MTKEVLEKAKILEEQIRRLTIALDEFENKLPFYPSGQVCK